MKANTTEAPREAPEPRPKHTLMVLHYLYAAVQAATAFPTPYRWGGKATPLSRVRPPLEGVDCSGFAQWFFYRASAGRVHLPEGSVDILDTLEREGYEAVSYEQACADTSGAVYVAGYSPRGQHAGHIWVVVHQHTLESYGGHGIGARDARHEWLVDHVQRCFKVYTQVSQSGGDN